MANQLVFIAFLAVVLCMVLGSQPVSDYDVIWNDIQHESATFYTNTMPIGNGDLAANVIAGDALLGNLSVLISQSSAWSEAGDLIKVGIVEFSFDPNPFQFGKFFQMHLDIAEATVKFLLGGTNASSAALAVDMYIDSNNNVIVINAASQNTIAYTTTVVAQLARPSGQTVTPAFDCYSYPVSADQYVQSVPLSNAVAFFHRNWNSSFVKNTLEGVPSTQGVALHSHSIHLALSRSQCSSTRIKYTLTLSLIIVQVKTLAQRFQ